VDVVSTPAAGSALRRVDARAALYGAAAALVVAAALGALLAGVIAAVDSEWASSINDADQRLTVIALVWGAMVLFVAGLTGGYVAGRRTRADGGASGLATSIAVLVVLAVVLLLVLATGLVEVPHWFTQYALAVAAVAVGVNASLGMLAGGYVGGGMGEAHERRAHPTDDAAHAGAGHHHYAGGGGIAHG
jgi:hypothetical protein